jgi:hypothetical protein
MLEHGWVSTICPNVKAAFALNPEVIVCMQIADAALALEQGAQHPKTAIIGFQSDGPTGSDATFGALDAIVVDASMLLTKVPMRYSRKTVHIPTSLEIQRDKYKPHKHPERELKLVYVGAMGNLHFGMPTITQLREKGYHIDIITDSDVATIPWDINTYADAINGCDVGIVPYPPDLQVDAKSFTEFMYKDPSRPTLFQAIGIPIVCSPLPSYMQYLRVPDTGLIANRLTEWVDRLNFLQDSVYDYERIARLGYEQSWNYADPELTGRAWCNVIERVNFHRVGQYAR